jgi:hypothetical protein
MIGRNSSHATAWITSASRRTACQTSSSVPGLNAKATANAIQRTVNAVQTRMSNALVAGYQRDAKSNPREDDEAPQCNEDRADYLGRRCSGRRGSPGWLSRSGGWKRVAHSHLPIRAPEERRFHHWLLSMQRLPQFNASALRHVLCLLASVSLGQYSSSQGRKPSPHGAESRPPLESNVLNSRVSGTLRSGGGAQVEYVAKGRTARQPWDHAACIGRVVAVHATGAVACARSPSPPAGQRHSWPE